MDETAFRTFYQNTAPQLHSYIRMMCNDATVADDLLQEAFYKFLRADPAGLNEFQMKA